MSNHKGKHVQDPYYGQAWWASMILILAILSGVWAYAIHHDLREPSHTRPAPSETSIIQPDTGEGEAR